MLSGRDIFILCSNMSWTMRNLGLNIVHEDDDDYDFLYVSLKGYWCKRLLRDVKYGGITHCTAKTDE